METQPQEGEKYVPRVLQELYDLMDKPEIVKDVAKKCGIDPSTLYRWMNHEVANPQRRHLKKVAEYFNITLEQLKGTESCQTGNCKNAEEPTIMEKRKIDPNLLKTVLVRKECDMEKLAKKCGFDATTIKTILQGGDISIAKYVDILEKLDVAPTELRAAEGLQDGPTKPATLRDPVGGEIIVRPREDGSIDINNKAEIVVSEISESLDIPINKKGVKKGSIHIFVEMEREDVDRLMAAFHHGKFDYLDIAKINIFPIAKIDIFPAEPRSRHWWTNLLFILLFVCSIAAWVYGYTLIASGLSLAGILVGGISLAKHIASKARKLFPGLAIILNAVVLIGSMIPMKEPTKVDGPGPNPEEKPLVGEKPKPEEKPLPEEVVKPNDAADRKAAEYILSIGGKIRLNDGTIEIKTDAEFSKAAQELKKPLRLTSVNLFQNKTVKDSDLAIFKKCNNLTHLELDYTNVSDTGLEAFKGIKTLIFLGLGNTAVTDKGLSNFAECRDLLELRLRQARQVNDAGLAKFSKCKKLQHVDLGFTEVTDASLAQIKECPKLFELHVQGTKVTRPGVNELRKALPDCKKITE